MLRITAKADDPRQRREVEANRFASLLLMPPHLLRGTMTEFREFVLQHALAFAHDFAVDRPDSCRIGSGRGLVPAHLTLRDRPFVSFRFGSGIATLIHRMAD